MNGIVPASDENVKSAGRILCEGGLVAFPTETVYGLGAHALDAQAVEAIFAAKQRPHTDPLIVHLPDFSAAAPLVRLSPVLAEMCRALEGAFWPGPLTLILPAADAVPLVVTSGGKSVGIRIPAHPVAQALLRAAGVPVAAPSANRFGHISPTRAAHVAADLDCEKYAIAVLDGGACPVGIESTILKLEEEKATILRRGSVTLLEVRSVLAQWMSAESIVAPARRVEGDDAVQSAPGQLLSHYAPDVPAYLVRGVECAVVVAAAGGSRAMLENAVVLDVGGRLAPLAGFVLRYTNLESDTDALRFAFDGLREAEMVEGARCILIPDLSSEAGESNERLLALGDRFFRSASGRTWQTYRPRERP